MCGDVNTCGFWLYEGRRKERRKGSERKRKEAKEERKCDTGKKLDEDGKYVVLNVTA